MELFVKVIFWVGFVGFIVRMLSIGVLTWPRTEEKTLGWHVAATLEQAAFTVWAAWVLWFH